MKCGPPGSLECARRPLHALFHARRLVIVCRFDTQFRGPL
ncbi:hypothetical protein AKJ09_01165 [Labilithrix luteola]|uniref:Uncharacterized protein n=1 Tax=Labilithrix luteola TaxID=1391654 RepID=A0A0K1PM75_9BACT|nr:hypothetical protein AKJ09_01165 [Labilithrix luteola]